MSLLLALTSGAPAVEAPVGITFEVDGWDDLADEESGLSLSPVIGSLAALEDLITWLLPDETDDETEEFDPVAFIEFGDFPHVIGTVIAEAEDEEDADELLTQVFSAAAQADWIAVLATVDEDDEDELEPDPIPAMPTVAQAVADFIQAVTADAEEEQEEFDTWLAQVIAPAPNVAMRSLLANWMGGASKPPGVQPDFIAPTNADLDEDEAEETGAWLAKPVDQVQSDFITALFSDDPDQDLEAEEEMGWTGYTQRIPTGTAAFRSLMAFWAGGGSQGPASGAAVPDWILRARRRGIR